MIVSYFKWHGTIEFQWSFWDNATPRNQIIIETFSSLIFFIGLAPGLSKLKVSNGIKLKLDKLWKTDSKWEVWEKLKTHGEKGEIVKKAVKVWLKFIKFERRQWKCPIYFSLQKLLIFKISLM